MDFRQPFTEQSFFLIAGPCVIESREHAHLLAASIRDLAESRGIPFVFKASFDKANRTSLASYRGVSMEEGLDILAEVRMRLGVPVLTDVHESHQCAPVAEAVDILQIPAFLCRQTDLLLAAAATGHPVNLKKGQFLAPWDLKNAVDKLRGVPRRRSGVGHGARHLLRLRPARGGLPELPAPAPHGLPRRVRRHPQRAEAGRPGPCHGRRQGDDPRPRQGRGHGGGRVLLRGPRGAGEGPERRPQRHPAGGLRRAARPAPGPLARGTPGGPGGPPRAARSEAQSPASCSSSRSTSTASRA